MKKYTTKSESEGISTEDSYFIDTVGTGLEALWFFLDLMWMVGDVKHDSTLMKIGLIGQTLVSDLKMKVKAFDEYAAKHCGRIAIESMHAGPDESIEDAWVNARFVPANPKHNVINLKTVKQ